MFCILALLLQAQTISIQTLRLNYAEIINDEKQCQVYLHYFKNLKNTTTTEKAFWAALTASSAQFIANPFTKIKIVKQAHQLFDDAILKDAANPELRYLRITVEQNTPRILGLSTHIDEDKKILLNRFQNYISIAGVESARQVLAFLKYHSLCSKEELSKIEKWIP